MTLSEEKEVAYTIHMTDVKIRIEQESKIHYYGDIVRRLFFCAALIMLVTFPFFNKMIPENPELSIAAIVIVGLLAALTNPRQLWTTILNTIVAILAVCVFEYYALIFYSRYSLDSAIFWINQLLSLLFLISLYYSVKTFRGTLVK